MEPFFEMRKKVGVPETPYALKFVPEESQR
jgi:hypothetical protein